MKRFIASCLLCLFLSIALPSGSPRFACASSIRSLSSSHRLPPFRPPLPIALTNTTNTTNATSTAPTPAAAPTEPTPSPTPELTKKYESPEDEEKDEEKKEGTKVGMIFLWIVVAFSLIWVICYFRDAILFFFANVSILCTIFVLNIISVSHNNISHLPPKHESFSILKLS